MTRVLTLLFTAVLLSAPALAQTTTSADPQGFTYHAESRRDPFVSLLRRGVEAPAAVVSRSAGIGGLTAADISLRGVMASRGEFVGIVQGSDSKTYIVRAGQKLADGTIRTIEKDAMVIVQPVSDPLAADKQRELRKALRQDEAR